jgi:hypothetical protein
MTAPVIETTDRRNVEVACVFSLTAAAAATDSAPGDAI